MGESERTRERKERVEGKERKRREEEKERGRGRKDIQRKRQKSRMWGDALELFVGDIKGILPKNWRLVVVGNTSVDVLRKVFKRSPFGVTEEICVEIFCFTV